VCSSILPNEGIDKVRLADFERNPAIPATRACIYVHLAHIGSESAERFVHTNARSAAREKCEIAGGGKVRYAKDRSKKNRTRLAAQCRATTGRNATARKSHGTEREE
jgi:hypothetical protein